MEEAEALREAIKKMFYIRSLMTYIEMEYDNIPSHVSEEMTEYFDSCWEAYRSGNHALACLPNAGGGFYENFLKADSVESDS